MSLAALSTPAKLQTVAERVRSLQAEARQLALDHIRVSMSERMEALSEACREIAEGGDAYPAGVQSLARQLALEMNDRLQTLSMIMAKAR